MDIEATLRDGAEALVQPRRPGDLRIALVVPQSGALGMTGPSAVDAALLATHEVNRAGGVRGGYVDLVLVDGGRRPEAVADEVDLLSRSDAVDAVVGFHTSDVHRAVEARVAGRTPYVFTPPHEGGSRRPGVVCTGTDPAHQIRHGLEWLTRRHGLRRWALVGNDYIWPRAVHRSGRALVRGLHAEVVLERLVPLGEARLHVDRLVDDLRSRRADGLLLSLVGRDLADFNRALQHSDLDRRLVRLSGALEENGLLATGGDRSGTLFAAMPSFLTLGDDRHRGLVERYAALLGPQAPVLDSYAEGVYDGLHLVATLARHGDLTADRVVAGAARVTAGRPAPVHLARADGLQFAVVRRDAPARRADTSIWK